MQFTILRLWAFSCMNLWSVQFNASTERWGASWPYFTTIKQGRPELNFSSCVFCVADCLANKTICHQLMQKSTRILTSIYSNDWIKKTTPTTISHIIFFPASYWLMCGSRLCVCFFRSWVRVDIAIPPIIKFLCAKKSPNISALWWSRSRISTYHCVDVLIHSISDLSGVSLWKYINIPTTYAEQRKSTYAWIVANDWQTKLFFFFVFVIIVLCCVESFAIKRTVSYPRMLQCSLIRPFTLPNSIQNSCWRYNFIIIRSSWFMYPAARQYTPNFHTLCVLLSKYDISNGIN